MTLLNVKCLKMNSKGQITIPRDLRDESFKEGHKVALLAYEDRIEIRPISYLNEKLGTTLASEKSLTKNWGNPKEDKTWEDL
ncbi:AbrB/MazE/SpoVT family DNA-binding domain-containing protein [Methanosarcina sp. Mfa9]|uniref:AbrB/MazE/SpoVT family DNA-binding domain-containing protein n=1 Tax=Methanosarcina sp. Mfa9 TaxID=3439063 RepID=UPI003F847574